MKPHAVWNTARGTRGASASIASVALVLALTSSAMAQTDFSQKAAAEVVFHEATKLLQDGQTEQACSKFEASQQLDPAVGTILRLADCYDRAGKTASAWATFQEAAAMAQAQGQAERVQIATERANELKTRLSYVTIKLTEANQSLAGLKVELSGSEIPTAILGTAIPVNPGDQRVHVSAPGYDAWSKQIRIEATPSNTPVTVPELQRGIVTEMPVSTNFGPPAVAVAPSANNGASQSANSGLQGDGEIAPSSVASQSLHDEGTGDGQRLFGYITGAVGVGALGVGGYFAYRAYDMNNQSLEHCLSGEPNACTERGKSLRDEARSTGTTATIIGAAGLAAVGTSLVLLLTAPSDSDELMSVTLTAGADGAGLNWGGTW